MGEKKYNFNVRPEMGKIDAFSGKVSEIVRRCMGNETGFRAGLIVIEACSNIVKHGQLTEEDLISVSLAIGENEVVITIEDTSREFNPLEVDDPNLENIELLQQGGMGIYLIKRFSKKAEYSYVDGRNILKITI
ncbi:anti-sigma regulatory factor [Mesotoga sp. SC_3PWM13N19]|nr:anti-sigma regulatory factor [Mesotoga sp. SC_3PWM13N19]